MIDSDETIGLRDFALKVYAAPGVQETCLKAQDEWGLNVPLLLFGLWAEVRGQTVSCQDIPPILALVRAYDDDLIKPLRALRRGLKTPSLQIDIAVKERFRIDVKAMELKGEMALLMALEGQAHLKSEPKSSGPGLLRALITAQNPNLCEKSITSLCDALFSIKQAL